MNEYKAINQGDEPMRVYVKYESSNFLYPEDMKKILTYLRDYGELCVPGIEVECLYSEFSGTRSAGWLIPADETLAEFAEWLNETECS